MRKTMGSTALLIAFIAIALSAQTTRQIAAQVNPNDLKADVSFLASDALEGRATPSRGLDIAAEYIAAQFRRVGLEPAGDDGYFQTAAYVQLKPSTDGLELILTINGRKLVIDKSAIVVLRPGQLNLENADAVIAPPPEQTTPVEVTPGGATFPSERYKGKIVITDLRGLVTMSRSQAALLIIAGNPGDVAASGSVLLIEASAPAQTGAPTLFVTDPAVRSALQEAKDAPVNVSAHIPGPAEEPVKVRNVIGVLRGSDPDWKDTCVIVSAHYDHLGLRANSRGDNIFNGANDDASGAAGVVAIAKALASQASRHCCPINF